MKAVFLLSVLCLSTVVQAKENIFWGQPLKVGKVTLQTFVRHNMKDRSHQMGLAFPAAFLQMMPAHDRAFVMPLPQKTDIRPFNHLVINWNPHGHIPPGIYDVPHFDFHFYFISNEKRRAITCSGADAAICMKQPSPDMIAEHYQPTPEGETQMGWHWFDARGPEFHGQPFKTAMIYGYYNGVMTFLEPMISKDFLLSQKKFAANVPQPVAYKDARMFPKSYSVEFDAKKKMYYLILSTRLLPEQN